MCADKAQMQLKEYQFSFDQADKDKSGTLSFSEIYTVLDNQGFKGTVTDAMSIFRHLDKDGDRRVTRDEFTDTMKNLPKMTNAEYSMRKMFKSIDKDGSGSLTMDEIKQSISSGGGDTDTLFKILGAIRKDADGKLSYEEFLQVFKNESEVAELEQLFRNLDKDKSGSLTVREIKDALTSNYELRLCVGTLIGVCNEMGNDPETQINTNQFIKLYKEKQQQKRQ